MNNKKKAVGYIRISSERQVNNESLATQREAIKRYADQNDIEIIEWFDDIAKSGKNAERDGLQNLLNYCLDRKNHVDHWIVYNMRRASRDINTYSSEVRLVLVARGVTVRSATEPGVDDTKEGRFMENLLVALGQLDNEGKAEVTIDNMRSLAMQGFWQHPPLHGYDAFKIKNTEGKDRPSMKPNDMAPKVKKVLERFSEGDITKAELGRYAKSVGLRSKTGNVLTDTSIKKMLETPEYAGYVHDWFTEYKWVEGKHEGLISPDTFDRNLLLLQKKNRSGELHLRRNPIFPLKELILCQCCKKPLYASSPRTGSGGHSPRYHCSRESCRGKVKSIKIEVVHKEFEHLLQKIKPTEGTLNLYKTILIREANNDVKSLNKRIALKRNSLDEIAQKRTTAIQKFIDGQITLEEKALYVDKLDNEKLVLTNELREFEEYQAVKESDVELAINVMNKVDKQWALSDVNIQAKFQTMLFPEGIVFDFNTKRFGTTQMSPLYRYVPNKKDLSEPEKSFLVAGAGLEPATSWL